MDSIRNPQVRVEIDRYKSQTIFVTGEVRSPNEYTMTGSSMTLLQALAMAGSPTANASNEVIVSRQPVAPGAEMEDPSGQPEGSRARDEPGTSLALKNGDVINVPKAQTFFISGFVRNTGTYVLDPGLTIEQAIALAGRTDRAGLRSASCRQPHGEGQADRGVRAAGRQGTGGRHDQGAFAVLLMTTAATPSPLTVIAPRAGWIAIGWRELWEYRELLGFLVWRDIKVRYKQTVLGASWAILQPLATMVVFSLLFGRLAKMPSDGLPYPIFAFAALLPWTFFANAVSASANSLVGNTHLISKVYFPRLLIAMSSIGAALLDLAVALVVLFGLLAFYGVGVTLQLAALPALALLTLLLAFGVGSALAALCALYRDVRYVVPFLLQLWMFASPVIYP